MKFFDDFLYQKNKKGCLVCGDYCVCERIAAGMIYVVCDGIGSGVYANVSAITCASRILALFRGGMSIRMASEIVAASMHRARKEDIPFSAFSAAVILPSGQFTVYGYEAPIPVLMQGGHASVPIPRFYTAGYEVISEVTGALSTDDCLLLFSDGISQAGMGHGHGMGIGSEGVADFINRALRPRERISALPKRIAQMCKAVSAGNYEDDTTLALIRCRDAVELTLLTGPPSKQSLDSNFALDFRNMPGQKIVCGSTTTNIVARELGLGVSTLSIGDSLAQPPEYWMKGADLVTEGAITLNQVYNILDEPEERLTGNSAVERMCLMLHGADIIHLMVGTAANAAHEDLLFKQIGINVRGSTIQQITEKLRSMGKLVIERYY